MSEHARPLRNPRGLRRYARSDAIETRNRHLRPCTMIHRNQQSQRTRYAYRTGRLPAPCAPPTSESPQLQIQFRQFSRGTIFDIRRPADAPRIIRGFVDSIQEFLWHCGVRIYKYKYFTRRETCAPISYTGNVVDWLTHNLRSPPSGNLGSAVIASIVNHNAFC